MRKKIKKVVLLTTALVLTFSQVLIPSESIGTELFAKQQDRAEVGVEAVGDSTAGEMAVQLSEKKNKNSQVALKKVEDKAGQEEDVSSFDIDEIDYDRIIEESRDEEYRDSVEISDNAIIVVRDERDDSKRITKEDWYQKCGATDYEVIMSKESADSTQTSYKITTELEDVWAAVDMINESEDVLIAEPEYVYDLCEEGAPSADTNTGMEKEWYLKDQNMSTVWSETATYGNTTGEGVIVAVIDTGVDYNHEDLKDNIWINSAELLGNEGVDDDGNGYVDDVYGINLISGESEPMDDNGHGTHVAGIIAMADNDCGGVGIAYNSKIMSIKAGGADGSFNSSDIAKAITYASKNGADVINMSFGSYAHSAIVESALQDAFGTSVLVAAAGNDAIPTLDAPVVLKGNMYPAAYQYVIGVMAYDSSNNIAPFSNWDYRVNYGAEYEVAAPGASIYSTLPGDRYASWSGTSMAAPMVSAVAAILRSSYSDKSVYSSRFIMGQIASATEDVIEFDPIMSGKLYKYSKLNVAHSITKSAKPNIYVDEVYIFDSTDISDKNNGDGIIQPGETIDIAVGLRNQWGAAKDVYVTVNATSAGGVENPYVTFTNGNEVKIDDIGTFATQNNGYIYDEEGIISGVTNPIRVTISETTPNDADIQFNINYHAKNGLSEEDTVYTQLVDTSYVVSVQRGTVLKGKVTSDMTLTKDNYYIVENSLLIPRGVNVTVEPGTSIQFWSSDQSNVYGDSYIAYIQVEGTMTFVGTEAEPINLFPGKDYEDMQVKVIQQKNGIVDMSYVNIINPYLQINNADHMNITQDYDSVCYRDFDSNGELQKCEGGSSISVSQMSDSKISNLRGNNMNSYVLLTGRYDTVLFNDCQISYNSIEAVNCTFLGNQGRVEDPWSGTLQYFSSKINNSGNRYMVPGFEVVTDIHTINGKKYVIYKFENYFYQDSEWVDGDWTYNSLNNFETLNKALMLNSGTIGLLDPDDANEKAVFEDFVKKADESYANIVGGYYYDSDTDRCVSTGRDLNSIECLKYNRPNSNYPIGQYYISKSTSVIEGEDGEKQEVEDIYVGSQNSMYMNQYVLVEYPDTVSDYAVKNPNMSPEQLEILQNTMFKNNAILNRLTNKDISNWMKVTSDFGNEYIFVATENYWGTTDEAIIQKQLIDFDTNIRFADILADSYLEKPAETTYPCVSDIYILDKNKEKVRSLGNGEYEVHVVFNRDMNTNVKPYVSYGPDDPYTDYTVEGDWINSKEWVGKANIKVFINQGQQYFRVKDAVAADDAWLTTGVDWARFTFNIEATGAEALVLQAEGVKGGVYLNWTQDDYDTLAGYNIYRSDADGEEKYERVNKSVVDATEKEFTDTSVLCGKVYKYYFTVVDTDMKESKASNIVKCASLDDEPPVIVVCKNDSLVYGVASNISASITDNVGVNSAILYYRMQGEEKYNAINMTSPSDSMFIAQIPAKALKVGMLEYYIAAADSENIVTYGSESEPKTISVESRSVISSVVCDGGKVGDSIEVRVLGVNFDENTKISIDSKLISTTFVSDKEIKGTYIPEYMGKKDVCISQNGDIVSKFTKAFDVTDDNVKIYIEDTILVREGNLRNVHLYTNFQGKLTSYEITYDYSQVGDCMVDFSTYYSSGSSMEWVGDKKITYKVKCNNVNISSGKIGAFLYQEVDKSKLPVIESFKINGVEVKNKTLDESKLTVINQEQYVPIESIQFVKNTIEMEKGETFNVDLKILPENATMKDKVTLDYDASILRRNEDGTFTSVQGGTTWIYAYSDNVSAEYPLTVNVKYDPITAINVPKTKYTGVKGGTISIEVEAQPLDSKMYLEWGITNNYEKIDLNTSNNGRRAEVVLKEEGTCQVEVRCGNIVKYITIEILGNNAYAEIEEEVMTMNQNELKKINASIMNDDSDSTKIKFKTSNTAVATVDMEGNVTAVGVGMAVITASIDGGVKSDTVIILVGNNSMKYTLGDVNMDGSITSVDALIALKLSIAGNYNSVILKIADVSGDGKITAADSMLILQYVTGAITEFTS